MIDNPNDAFAQYEAQARLRAQLAREVTPLNKAALYDAHETIPGQFITVRFVKIDESGRRCSTTTIQSSVVIVHSASANRSHRRVAGPYGGVPSNH